MVFFNATDTDPAVAAHYLSLGGADPDIPPTKRHVLVVEVYSHEHQNAMQHMCDRYRKVFEDNGTVCGSSPRTMPALNTVVSTVVRQALQLRAIFCRRGAASLLHCGMSMTGTHD
jgi:hypothetical protein